MVTPYLGALSEAYPDDDVRELYEDPYRIFYRIESERIDIVAVMHSAKRLPRKL